MSEHEQSDAPAAIVRDDQLGGQPRLDGHRIGVHHIWTHYQQEKSIEQIAEEVYSHLRIEQVQAAVGYARANPEEMAALEREREWLIRDRMRRARKRKRLALGMSCPKCGGQLIAGEDLPLALVACSSCGDEHVVKLLLEGASDAQTE
ncbi:hypothetical protein HLRTI_002610 [Halorhabdus tiamatea SARL4B]|uniref:Uncharacterized protein n=1 Tax=Halorhabdus tiamatea SARL4B TaxID=1033806 RepID=F7PGA7_9EURY|nr:DUF433 domain-containing protein [Halorhabdus tiamatea]ERJ05379.1 hypothetical protein HLRTI_002610 [Halorhabdus tiamatea SARL4B]CCQ33149.1 hypothetical protein (DUF433) [Halorhabdus tiamatea SARL4B]